MKTTQKLFGLSIFAFSILFSNISLADDNSSGVAQLLEPAEALELIQSEPLKYVGMFYPSNSESGIPSCLFRNAKVTVMYTYCRKSEAPALGLTVYSNTPERGNIRFYAEGDGRPVSQLDRQEYEKYMWRFLARSNADGYRPNMTAKEYKEYYEKEIYDYRLGCFIWEQPGETDLRAGCKSPFEAQVQSWLPGALDFWHEPPQAWYDVQKMLRKLVLQTR